VLKTQIIDGAGTSKTAQVTSDNSLKVSAVPIKIVDQTIEDMTRKKQYRDWLTNSVGSADMNVDGSVTPVSFTETAEAGKVKWIDSWRLIMHGTYLELDTNDFRRFGLAATAPGLTNGLEFYFVQGGRTINVFLENVKNIGDFMKYADNHTNFINAVSAQEDYLAFDFKFDQTVVLPAGSNDKIVLVVNDNLSSLVYMRCIVRGWQEFEEAQ